MKYSARASRAPAVAPLGRICAHNASTSTASAALKNSSLGAAFSAACSAWCPAAAIDGQCVSSHAPVNISPPDNRKERRDRSPESYEVMGLPLDLAALGKLPDVIGSAEGERLDGFGWLPTA